MAEKVVVRGITVRPSLDPVFAGEEGEMSKGLRMAEDYQNIVSILQGLGAVPESLMRPPEHQLRGCGTGEGLGDPDDLKEGTPWL